MKKILPFYKVACLWAITNSMIGCCKKNDAAFDKPIAIMYKIRPTHGQYDAEVIIYGRYFNTLTGAGIQFNGLEASITGTTDSTITVKVPKGAGSGNVTLSANGITLTGPVFEYDYKVTVSNVAGPANGRAGYVNGNGAAVRFNGLYGLAIDGNDNVYVSESQNHCIRKMDAQGNVTLFAGMPRSLGYKDAADGKQAQFNAPQGLCVDRKNNLFLVDPGNYRVRKMTTDGAVTTIAGNGLGGWTDHVDALYAEFYPGPYCTADAGGNVYVSNNNCSIRKIVPGGGVSTITGAANEVGFRDAYGGEARFCIPLGIACNNAGELLVADSRNARIRKVSSSFAVSTFSGTGLELSADASRPLLASFATAGAVILDKKGNLLIGETYTGHLRMITPAGRVVTLTKGGTNRVTDGDGSVAGFGGIVSIGVNSKNEVYVADAYNCIRKVIIE